MQASVRLQVLCELSLFYVGFFCFNFNLISPLSVVSLGSGHPPGKLSPGHYLPWLPLLETRDVTTIFNKNGKHFVETGCLSVIRLCDVMFHMADLWLKT